MFRNTCNAAQGSTEGVTAAPVLPQSGRGSVTASDPTAGDAGMSLFRSTAVRARLGGLFLSCLLILIFLFYFFLLQKSIILISAILRPLVGTATSFPKL